MSSFLKLSRGALCGEVRLESGGVLDKISVQLEGPNGIWWVPFQSALAN